MSRNPRVICAVDGCERLVRRYVHDSLCQMHRPGAGEHVVAHGTLNEYSNYGCRCRVCQTAQHEYNASRMISPCWRCGAPSWNKFRHAGRGKWGPKQEPVCFNCFQELRQVPIQHGTETGHKRGCRCPECVQAATVARRNRRHRQAARERESKRVLETHHGLIARIREIPDRDVKPKRSAPKEPVVSIPSNGGLDPLSVPSFESRGEGKSLLEVVDLLMDEVP